MDEIGIYIIKYCEELKKYIHAKPHTYDYAIEELWSTPFRWNVDLDERRVRDAEYYIRSQFDKDGILDENHVPISTLEVLIAMSYRCEHDVMGTRGDGSFYEWFWIFFKNLGLKRYDDRHFDQDAVDDIIDRWLDGDIGERGDGSPFLFETPVKNPELLGNWNLMNRFLSDYYL